MGRPRALTVALGFAAALATTPWVAACGSDNTITVGANPFEVQVAVTPDDDILAYVANEGDDTVSVIDTATNEVVDTVNVGDSPIDVAVGPNGKRVFVTNFQDGTVSVIETATNTVVDTIDDDRISAPTAVAVSPEGDSAYVTNQTNGTVSVLDTNTNTVIDTISDDALNGFLNDVAVRPDGRRAYVTNFAARGKVAVIDTASNTVVDSLNPTGRGVTVSPDHRHVYVTNHNRAGNGTVSVYDAGSSAFIDAIEVGLDPHNIAVSPDARLAYVTNYNFSGTDGTVSVIDTFSNRVIGDPIPVGNGAQGVAVSPDGTVYVTNRADGTVSVIAAPE